MLGPDSQDRCEDVLFLRFGLGFDTGSHVTQADLKHTAVQEDLKLETPLPTTQGPEITGKPCRI